jgi:hypothetical protein
MTPKAFALIFGAAILWLIALMGASWTKCWTELVGWRKLCER